MLIDTHCHLDLEQFASDRGAVIERALAAGVDHILIPGLSLISSRSILQMVGMASSFPALHAAIGVHPTEAGTWEESTRRELKGLIDPEAHRNPRIAAIGEIGLDYYWEAAPHDLQQNVLREQLELAAEMELPVILHLREAGDTPSGPCAEDLLHLLRDWAAALKTQGSPLAGRPGVLHSFAGSLETAQSAIQLGFYIGVTGPVTFTNARRRQEIVSQLPLDRLLTETDAPFMAPHPYRGRRNEPAYVSLIADKIALLHSISPEAVAQATSGNAARLFDWK